MTWASIIEKSVAQGAIIAGVAYFCYPNIRAIRVNWVNTLLPSWAVCASTGAIASVVSDQVHNFVKEEIHINQKASDEASMVIGAAISSASLYGVLYIMNRNLAAEFGYGCAVAAGTAGEFGAAFLVNLFKGV